MLVGDVLSEPVSEPNLRVRLVPDLIQVGVSVTVYDNGESDGG